MPSLKPNYCAPLDAASAFCYMLDVKGPARVRAGRSAEQRMSQQ